MVISQKDTTLRGEQWTSFLQKLQKCLSSSVLKTIEKVNVICARHQDKGDRDNREGMVLGIDPAKGVLEGSCWVEHIPQK